MTPSSIKLVCSIDGFEPEHEVWDAKLLQLVEFSEAYLPRVCATSHTTMCHLTDALNPTCPHTSLWLYHSKERIGRVHDSVTATAHSLCCPFCEVYELKPFGHNSVRCEPCGAILTGPLLETLLWITELPDVVGRHACECGHPEMRRLPDEVYWCPACGSEVLPA